MEEQPTLLLRITAGFLLISFTITAVYFLIGLWPDRLPDPKDNLAPLYRFELFHMRLACISDTPCCAQCDYSGGCLSDAMYIPQTDSARCKIVNVDSGQVLNLDSVVPASIDTPEIQTQYDASSNSKASQVPRRPITLIHINTLLLLLVALAGFTGNMIHIATSFTTFVGDKKFEKSWLLWYTVKPFTAMALALAVYFVFRGGFLSANEETPSINLYGIMTIALLTGLFTDRATMKLKEVFEVLFKPDDERRGKREDEVAIDKSLLAAIKRKGVNNIELKGSNMNRINGLIISMGGTAVENPTIKPDLLSFSYVLPPERVNAQSIELVIKDEKGKVYQSQIFPITDE